jgi:predicted nucleotidyltransferase
MAKGGTSMRNDIAALTQAPEPQRSALRAFVSAAREDERIAAAFIGGSFASGSWDAHSDLDLYVVVEEDAYDAFFADRREFVGRLGALLLAEDFNGFGFDMLVFLTDAGAEGELGIGRRSGFGEMHGGPYIAVKDAGGVLPAEFPMVGPSDEQRAASLRRTVAWFWRHLALFATAAARGRTWSAFTYLDAARREAFDLVWLLERPEGWPEAYEKAELHLDAATLDVLARTVTPLDLDAMRSAARALAAFVADRAPDQVATRDLGRQVTSRLSDEA